MLLLCVLFVQSLCGQIQLDSLKDVIHSDRALSKKYNAYRSVMLHYLFADKDSAYAYAEKLQQAGKIEKDSTMYAYGFTYKAVIASSNEEVQYSIECGKQALAAFEKLNHPQAKLERVNLGIGLTKTGAYDDALRIFEKGLTLAESEKDTAYIIYNSEELINTRIAIGNLNGLHAYSARLTSVVDGTFAKETCPEFVAARIYEAEGDIAQAYTLFCEAILCNMQKDAEDAYMDYRYNSGAATCALEMGFKNQTGVHLRAMESHPDVLNTPEVYPIYLGLKAKYHSIAGEFEQAYQHVRKQQAFVDSLSTAKNMQEINELNAQFLADEKEKELLKLKHSNETAKLEAKLMWIAGGSIIFGLLVVSFVLIFNNRRKQRMHALLRQQHDENVAQKSLIENQQNKLISSISYALGLQQAILPSKEKMVKCLGEHVLFYRPKDIVSGDFYWVEKVQDGTLVAAVDCTGHGVPGAFMTIIANNTLNEIVLREGITDVAAILEALRQRIPQAVQKKDGVSSYGLDIAICKINKEEGFLEFAGSEMSALLWQNEALLELKPSGIPIGTTTATCEKERFISQRYSFQSGDKLYLFTDGLQDQFGGSRGRKFNKKNMRELCLALSQTQCFGTSNNLVEQRMAAWQGKEKQVDDMLFFGVGG